MYPTSAYFAKLRADITATKPGDRILLATMNFEPEQTSFPLLIAELQDAATRGVQVSLGVDAHDFMLQDTRLPGPLLWRRQLPERAPGRIGKKLRALDELQAAGVTVGITNQPHRAFTNPFAGRSHIKVSIINDVIYTGGCNLKDEINIDLMARWEDDVTADWLYTRMHKMISTQYVQAALGKKDIVRRVDERAELLIDVGVPHQSIIYERALQAIEQAEDWLIITCQYFPNSTTALALKRAFARGVRVYPIFNHHSQHLRPHSYLQHGVTARERLRMPASFFEGELPRTANPLHAKLIATEKEALLGSHNYVPAGVNFGTAEIALHVRDPKFAVASAQSLLAQTPWQSAARFAYLRK